MIGVLARGCRAAVVLRWRALRARRSFSDQIEFENEAFAERMQAARDEARGRGVPLRDVLGERGML